MRFLGSNRLAAFVGLIALCGFAGDIVADSVSDGCCEPCTSQNSPADSPHEKAPCAGCSCAVHNGSAIASSNALQVTAAPDTSFLLPVAEPPAPDGVRPAIDHPPQLS